MTLIHMLFLGGLFGSADYLTGRDWKHWGWPTRSIYAVAPCLMVVLFCYGVVFGGHWWAAIGFAWGLYRCLFGWSSFKASVDPQTNAEVVSTLIRNGVSAMFVVGALCIHGTNPVLAVGSMFAFAMVATFLAVLYGYYVWEEKIDIGPQIDIARGIAFGLILGIVC